GEAIVGIDEGDMVIPTFTTIRGETVVTKIKKVGPNPETAPKVEEVLIGGNKVELKNNAVEVSFYDTSTVIPEIKVTFKEAVKVSAITDENGKVYNTPEQFETAKGWLGYTGDLSQ